MVSAFGPGLIKESDAPLPEEASTEWVSTPQAAALDVLERAAWEATDAGVKAVEIFPREGDPAEAILALADEQGCDLIVVGNKGMTGARRLLGSVPNQISHHAPCSVLIVHTT
jgi:nucleotide-binding universal stress UspA family protein